DFEQQIADKIVQELRTRLQFLHSVGLDYLTLDRTAATLSGGEGQRMRLATQIGSGLVGVLYILDEPSIGLHQRDNQRLLESLRRLRDLGNTVLVVEHDRDTILTADYVLDLGPGAGEHGGRLVAAGTPSEIMHHPASLTGQYLSGQQTIPIPTARRQPDGRWLRVLQASQNNLQHLDVEIPLGLLVCLTGVSGSGKSTLLLDILYKALAQRLHRARERPGAFGKLLGLEHLDKVIHIDQSPIGRTPRSNPATYTGVFDAIRELFAQVPEARVRGYQPGRFSFNLKGGRCEACQGHGTLKIEMHFLPDVYVRCDTCKGQRFNRDTLEIRYKGKHIAEVLDLTVEAALDFFANVPAIMQKLKTLHAVGLGYLRLGQAATTLSGGEAQRVKLSRELSRRSTGRTVYILDEPTTGLHFADIARLLEVLGRLVEAGNTVLVIEHNLEVIKTADYLIDLGPEGGDAGGRLVAMGAPEVVAQVEDSSTGRYLREVLYAPPAVCSPSPEAAAGI
ncbi:MAG TPA: excinuclease ABC subunit UvrA, partial [Candidatus Tectomicrobia bacterium]